MMCDMEKKKLAVIGNGYLAGMHTGGYTPFECDLSQFIEDENTLCVCVVDPTDTRPISRGKQKTEHGGIWYTPTSGIWQSVWIEYVPKTYIRFVYFTPDIDKKSVKINLYTNAGKKPFSATVDGKTYNSEGDELTIQIDDVKLW